MLEYYSLYYVLRIQCPFIVTCSTPDIPEDGSIEPANGPYDQGQQVVFNCDSGFQLRGVPAVECQQDGTWTDNSPICIKGYFSLIIIILNIFSIQVAFSYRFVLILIGFMFVVVDCFSALEATNNITF